METASGGWRNATGAFLLRKTPGARDRPAAEHQVRPGRRRRKQGSEGIRVERGCQKWQAKRGNHDTWSARDPPESQRITVEGSCCELNQRGLNRQPRFSAALRPPTPPDRKSPGSPRRTGSDASSKHHLKGGSAPLSPQKIFPFFCSPIARRASVLRLSLPAPHRRINGDRLSFFPGVRTSAGRTVLLCCEPYLACQPGFSSFPCRPMPPRPNAAHRSRRPSCWLRR
ncbi:hypothetical protein Pla8534_06650 [Lignipirellula cremea]|uniref:Uncharacterized protein n=1 Tax=Lignipirellula cremea TaxID=2528010 RepID=A0A518DM48_9BACT|nr:hypothetical protein Pla8534_06650 [Lignipirellula cremea]